MIFRSGKEMLNCNMLNDKYLYVSSTITTLPMGEGVDLFSIT
jgi:hypothetical protein